MPFWETFPGSAFINRCSIWRTASVTSLELWIQWRRVPRWGLPFGPDNARSRPMASAADFIEIGFVRFTVVLRNFIFWQMACFVVTVLKAIMFWKPVRAHQAPIVVTLYSMKDVFPVEHLWPVLILLHFEILVCIIIWDYLVHLSTRNPFPPLFNIPVRISQAKGSLAEGSSTAPANGIHF